MLNTHYLDLGPYDRISRVESLARILLDSREWHAREQDAYAMHPVVLKAFALASPLDWHSVVLEWPHVSVKEPAKLAYTRDEAKGEADIQTTTAIGKYLKKNWPQLKDDVIRDLVYKFSAQGCKVVRTSEEIVDAVQNGPKSCMQWTGENRPHPYEAYAPELGWGCAVRIGDDGRIDARALVFEGLVGRVNTVKGYVRSYRRPDEGDGGMSGSDHQLEAWLDEQGYSDLSAWPYGVKIAKVPSDEFTHGNLFPYLDGSNDQVEEHEDYYVICSSGKYSCDSTDGDATFDEDDDRPTCDECGDPMDDDERTYIEHLEIDICDHCCNRNFTRVTGTAESSRGRTSEYYVRDGNVVKVDDEHYDENNLPSYIIDCDHGGLAHEDNVITCSESGDTYNGETFRNELVKLHSGETVHEDYTFRCYGDGEYYLLSEVYPVEVGDDTYHPDNVPDTEEGEAAIIAALPTSPFETILRPEVNTNDARAALAA